MRTKRPTDSAGIGVDARGDPVIDPTQNVLLLVQAATDRLDDLRDAEARRIDELRVAESRRVDELRICESRRVNEQLVIRSEYDGRLEVAEAKRIDAIRAVDVNAVAVASQRAADQATVLANQVAQSAEALRALVATTATTVGQRITTLEQAQYEGKGKSTVADPQLERLSILVEQLARTQQVGTGKAAGADWLWKALLAAAGMGVAVYAAMKP